MSEYAMLIDYEYCTGCKSCEVACKQEYHRPSGRVGGVEVKEFIHRLPMTSCLLPIFHVYQSVRVLCGKGEAGPGARVCQALHGQHLDLWQTR